MSEIRELTQADFEAFAQLSANAYPGVPRTMEQILEGLHSRHSDPAVKLMGLFRQGTLAGGYNYFDFTMTLLDQAVTIGGIGGVAVHMLHKKQRVAYQMLQHFLRQCRENQQPLALLYPFRPDFYRRMGFAYGTPVHHYRIDPAGIVQGQDHPHLRFGSVDDSEALAACYNRYAAATHGMIQRSPEHFANLNPALRSILYTEDETVRGYLLYRFRPAEPANLLNNDMHVTELVYETPAALSELLTFLGRQADQAARIIFETQDPHFLYLLNEPRNDSGRYHETNTQGIAWMPRVVDLPGIFAALADHNFGGQTLDLGIDLVDDFLPENAGMTVIRFEQGQAQVLLAGKAEATIRLHVREFTQLLMGIVDFHWLLRVGLVTLDNSARRLEIQRTFAWDQKPVCMTFF